MSLNTPLSTPTKCGCVGGIVVPFGVEESLRNKPRSKRTKKNSRSISTGQCALCSQEKMRNIRCAVGKAERNRIISDAIDKTDTPQIKTDDCGREQDAVTEKKWYATVIRGALGRWSARGKSRSPSRKEHLRITPGSLSDVPSNSCTNNNSKPTERCGVHKDPRDCKNVPRMGTFGLRTTHKSDPDLYGRKLCDKPGSEAKGRHSRVFGDNITTQDDCSVKTPPEAASSVRVRRPRGFNGMAKRPKSDSGPRLKLPSLPYRDSEILPKTNINGKEKDKRQRSKKKFLSSPIRVKEVSQESQKGQSTYVSFQDDFTKDVHLNVDAQNEIISASASPATQRSGSTSDSPLQVSPTSLTDDVFTENYVNTNGKQPIYVHGENDLGSSREELEDARIAKLFQKVNTAFEKDQGADGTRLMHQAEIRSVWASQRGHAQLDSVAGNATHKVLSPSTKSAKFQGEHIETIMTSANLHASLDNALSMLNESTKLLSPNDSHGWTSGISNSKHQLSGGVLRSRTYSTCSRLEPIAEEIDKSEAVVDELGNDVGDGTSCTFSDSSEYEKFNFPNSRVNHYVQQGISSSRVSISSGSSLSTHYWENSLTSGNTYTAPVKELDPKLKWLISTSRGTTRNNSTSTISVRSLHRKRGLMESNVFGPTTAEKCAACEWARRVQFPPTVSVIPYAAWRRIVKDCGGCHERAHFHPWGICGEHHTTPVLCHSHYLQYYQHLQNDQRANRGVRHALHPSQADSIIDYDIHEVMSDLDDLVVSGTENSSERLHQSTFHHNELCSLNNGQAITSVQSNVRSHIVDVQLGKGPYKHSDTDVSVNCDSAFSTNGSPTPSTRDGINTDRESVGSINDKIEAEEHGFRRMSGLHNDPWVRSDEYIETSCLSSRLQSGDQRNSPRGKRTQSYDDAKSGISSNKRATKHHENRYSLVSSVYSYPSPLTSDDSAVHLQDSASSRSTHLSSDSFYSSGTSFGDKETCLVDGSNDSDALSRSSSEASLQSEGTLCLSEFARSQQNISLFSAPSFPQISDLCSPTRQGNLKQPLPENEVVDQFDDWVNKAKVTESILESFLNSSLAHMQENEASTSVASDSSNEKPPSDTSTIRNTDTLASSSGSSDTNTLGSGSSGSTYATSSLRSYSRFNTLDSSSCVSTDDTGETVVDQYMLRPGGRLHNIEERETTKHHRLKKKRSYDATRMRYQPSAFHYQNLEAPSFSNKLDAPRATSNHAANISFPDGEIQMRVLKDVTKTTHITTKGSRSSSMSCVTTSVTKTACMVRHTKSLPCIYLSHVTDQRSVQKHTPSLNPMDDLSPKPLPQIYGRVLRSKVHSMMRSCSDIDNVIAALMDSLKSTSTIETEKYLDEKLLELSKILKQKDEMINQLHQMLLACSVPERHVGHNHQLNATM